MSSTDADPLSGLSVLIVEDEFLIAAEAQQIVEHAGAATVNLANSVAAARTALANDPGPDVVILDLNLGLGEDGSVLVEELARRRVPFVIASGFQVKLDPVEPHHAAMARGTLLTKPYGEADLIEAVVTAIARARNG